MTGSEPQHQENEAAPHSTPGEPVQPVSDDLGEVSEPVQLEIFLRIGGEWRHMSGSFQGSEVKVAAGNDPELVVYEAEVGSIDEAVTTLATVTRGEFDG